MGRETEPRDHSLLTELNIQETHKCTDTYRIAICVCHVLEFKAIIPRGPQREYQGTRLLNLDGLLEVHVQGYL